VHDVEVCTVCNYPDFAGVYQFAETLHGELQQRLASAQHINKLLGPLGGAHGPETASYTAGHDNEMITPSAHNLGVF
jgi:hypothetical protein